MEEKSADELLLMLFLSLCSTLIYKFGRTEDLWG